jgi:hypothetical protein
LQIKIDFAAFLPYSFAVREKKESVLRHKFPLFFGVDRFEPIFRKVATLFLGSLVTLKSFVEDPSWGVTRALGEWLRL